MCPSLKNLKESLKMDRAIFLCWADINEFDYAHPNDIVVDLQNIEICKIPETCDSA